MSRLLLLLVCLAILAFTIGLFTPAKAEAADRVKKARELREGKLRGLHAEYQIPYPPGALYLRAFKQEQVLEVWAGEKNKPLQLLATYPFTAYSGRLGPKRREGDLQIPEGIYHIERFNPRSSFHLSLGLNYPNGSDRKFADQEKPGSDIFIHGRDKSVGCIAIGDEAIEEVYILARDFADETAEKIPVHIFPARMNSPEWKPGDTPEAKEDQGLLAYWNNLEPIFRRFEDTRRVPAVTVDENGLYVLAAAEK